MVELRDFFVAVCRLVVVTYLFRFFKSVSHPYWMNHSCQGVRISALIVRKGRVACPVDGVSPFVIAGVLSLARDNYPYSVVAFYIWLL